MEVGGEGDYILITIFISAQLSTDVVSTLRTVYILIRLCKQHSDQARTYINMRRSRHEGVCVCVWGGGG